jgi:Phage endonuclease I
MLSNGVILEAKGFFRPGDVAKMRAVKSANPDLDIRFVFQEPHRKIPGQKQTHAQWAERHGFPWAGINDVPLDWINND